MTEAFPIALYVRRCIRPVIFCAGFALLPFSGAVAKDFGLALTELNYGPWTAADECPEGFAVTGREALMQSTKAADKADIEAFQKRVGGSSDYVTRVLYERRGANGADVCENPTQGNDPPMPISRAKISEGFDLDGGDTKSHCAHSEFVGADGTPGIDNQVRRLMACIKSVRDNRTNEALRADIQSGGAVTLLRVTGVTNMENDDSVTVEIYKGRDPFVKDGSGQPLPDATMRADKNAPLFKAVTHGKIVNGVLITDPVDARFMMFPAEYLIREARFRIKLGADGFAEGLLGGYFDVDSFWDSWARNPGGQIYYSCPSLYKSLHALADGYKDPKTGQCTALSTAFNIKAVRTFVIPPSGKPQS